MDSDDSDFEVDVPDEFLWKPSDAGKEEIEDVELHIVTRDSWGAQPPKEETALPHPVRHILFMYTNSDPCHSRQECNKVVREIQRRQMEEEGLPDIRYNFYITADTTVYEGRGWHVISSQPHEDYVKMEKQILNIGYIGHFQGEPYPDVEVMQVRDELLRLGIKHGYVQENFNNLITVADIKS